MVNVGELFLAYHMGRCIYIVPTFTNTLVSHALGDVYWRIFYSDRRNTTFHHRPSTMAKSTGGGKWCSTGTISLKTYIHIINTIIMINMNFQRKRTTGKKNFSTAGQSPWWRYRRWWYQRQQKIIRCRCTYDLSMIIRGHIYQITTKDLLVAEICD